MSMKLFLTTWGMIIVTVILNVVGVTGVKLKLNELGSLRFDSFESVFFYFTSLIKSPFAVIGGILIMISPFPYLVAVSRMDVSLVYPITVALTCLLLIPISVIFLGESIVTKKAVGILLLIISIWLLHK